MKWISRWCDFVSGRFGRRRTEERKQIKPQKAYSLETAEARRLQVMEKRCRSAARAQLESRVAYYHRNHGRELYLRYGPGPEKPLGKLLL